jgi:hypothetical protein
MADPKKLSGAKPEQEDQKAAESREYLAWLRANARLTAGMTTEDTRTLYLRSKGLAPAGGQDNALPTGDA